MPFPTGAMFPPLRHMGANVPDATILPVALALALLPPHHSLIAQEWGSGTSLSSGGLTPSAPLQPASLQPSGPLGGSGFDPSYNPSEQFWMERAERARAKTAAKRLPTEAAVESPLTTLQEGFPTTNAPSIENGKSSPISVDLESAAQRSPDSTTGPESDPSALFLKPSPGTFLGTSHNPALENLLFEGSVLPRSLKLPGDRTGVVGMQPNLSNPAESELPAKSAPPEEERSRENRDNK